MQNEINKALEVLHAGGVILYPTDTIWGIGCDATNAEAVRRVYEIKQRADSKSMLVLLHHDSRLQGYVQEVPDMAWELIDLATSPLTIIYPQAKNLAPNLIAADGSIGIRITNEAFSQKLIERFRKPIVSTSANIAGQASPAFFDQIDESIRSQVDYVVQWRQDERTKNKASQIIQFFEDGSFAIIRK